MEGLFNDRFYLENYVNIDKYSGTRCKNFQDPNSNLSLQGDIEWKDRKIKSRMRDRKMDKIAFNQSNASSTQYTQ